MTPLPRYLWAQRRTAAVRAAGRHPLRGGRRYSALTRDSLVCPARAPAQRAMGSLEVRCCYKTSEHRVKVPADSSFADVKVSALRAGRGARPVGRRGMPRPAGPLAARPPHSLHPACRCSAIPTRYPRVNVVESSCALASALPRVAGADERVLWVSGLLHGIFRLVVVHFLKLFALLFIFYLFALP